MVLLYIDSLEWPPRPNWTINVTALEGTGVDFNCTRYDVSTPS